MRIQRILKKETSDAQWVHVVWVEKSPQQAERELDRLMTENPEVYKWSIVPYREIEDGIKEFFRRT